jgi:amino acid adenylation domain-containing protein
MMKKQDSGMRNTNFSILQKLTENLQEFSASPAFYINGISFSYMQFQQRIAVIQNHILSEIREEENYIGILSCNDIDTYASIFALWFSGKAFVPLNPLNPPARNTEIIQQMALKHILCPGDPSGISAQFLSSITDTKALKEGTSDIAEIQVSSESDAYVLFTSGSTGRPKGVRINRANLDAFYKAYLEFGPEYSFSDRFLQIYDISFDGSIPCYLVALCAGASVFTVPQDEIKYLYALRLMRDHALTVLKMTPSTLYYLRPFFNRINLPDVRVCIFGGEALPLALVEEWMKCVPNALIQNAYGPTEATIDSLMYNFNAGDFQKKSYKGIISLGKCFGDFEYAIINDSGTLADNGKEGELCLYGSQVMSGYWKDDEKTASAFFHWETAGQTEKFYRTGDLVYKDADGYFMYLGRADNQVQVQGYRVELGEIEHIARHVLGEINLAAVSVTNQYGNPEIILYIEGQEKQKQDGEKWQQEEIVLYLRSKLPHYMVPSRIIFMKELPLLASGKTDRKKLSEKANLYEID